MCPQYDPVQQLLIDTNANALAGLENLVDEVVYGTYDNVKTWGDETARAFQDRELGETLYAGINTVTGGLVDNTVNGFVSRSQARQENPSAYNIANELLLGLPDAFGPGLFPKSYGLESNSPEHWEAIWGALATEVGILSAIKGVNSQIKKATVNPHSTEALQILANDPANKALNQTILTERVATEQFINTRIPAEFQASVRKAFESDIKAVTLTDDLVVYRYHGGTSQATSHWYTPHLYEDPISSLALPAGNSAQFVDTYVIPKGVTVLEGHVAPNFGQPGQGFQIYVAGSDFSKILPH